MTIEAAVATWALLGGLIAILGAAAMLLIQTAGDRYSLRMPAWRFVPRRVVFWFGLMVVAFLWAAVVCLFDFRGIWAPGPLEVGLRADWGLLVLLGIGLVSTAFIILDIPNMLSPGSLISRLVAPMFDEFDLWSSWRVLPPARDVAAAALMRSDLEAWDSLVSSVREGIANNLLLWHEASTSGIGQMFGEEVGSFAEFLLEASKKHGHPVASASVARMLTHLLKMSVEWGARVPASLIVRVIVRTARWALDNDRPGEVSELVRGLSAAALSPEAAPYSYPVRALKQVGDWIVQEPPRPTTGLDRLSWTRSD